MSRSKDLVPTKRSYHKEYVFIWNMKPLTLAVEKLLTRFKFSKSRPNSKVKVTESKYFGTNGNVLSQGISMWNIKTQALASQKVKVSIRITEWQTEKKTIPQDLHRCFIREEVVNGSGWHKMTHTPIELSTSKPPEWLS